MIKIIKETITDFVMMFIMSLFFSSLILVGTYLIDLKIDWVAIRVYSWISFVVALFITGKIYFSKERDRKLKEDYK